MEDVKKPSRKTGPLSFLGRVDPVILALLVALIVLMAVIGVQKPKVFFLPKNLLNIGQAVTLTGLVTLAQTVIIISGGMDLSVGSIVGLVSICIGLAMQPNDSVLIGVAVGLVVGGFLGLVNALLITVGKIEPVIATLGTMAVFRGAAFIMTKGAPIGVMSTTFNKIGSGAIAGISIPVVILILTAVAFHIFLTATDTGRKVFALGGNAIAARLSGIPVDRYKIGIFVLSGLVTGLAAVILTARSNAGLPNSGVGVEFDTITAAALGGAALSGGRGTILGAVLGVIILGVLQNGMILLGVSQFYQFVAKGSLLVLAALLQRWMRGT